MEINLNYSYLLPKNIELSTAYKSHGFSLSLERYPISEEKNELLLLKTKLILSKADEFS